MRALGRVSTDADSKFAFVSQYPILPEIGLSLSFGADGLSLAMLMLAAIVTVSAVWIIPPIKSASISSTRA